MMTLEALVEHLWDVWHTAPATVGELEAATEEAYAHPEWPEGYSVEGALFGREEDGNTILAPLPGYRAKLSS